MKPLSSSITLPSMIIINIERKDQSVEFPHIFTVAILVFLAPVASSNPAGKFSNHAGHSLTLE